MARVASPLRLPGDPWFVALMVAFVTIHGATNLILPMASYRALQLGAPPEALGLLTTAFSIPPLIVAIRVGRIVDEKGGLAFITGGLALMAVAAVLLATAPSFAVILGAFCTLGLGHLTAAVATQGIIARASHQGGYDQRFSTMSLASSFGQLLGPAIGGVIAGEGSPESTVRALVAGGIVAVLGIPVALAAGRLAPQLGEPRRPRPAAAGSAVGGRAAAGGTAPAGTDAGSAAPTTPSFVAIMRTPGLAWAIVVSTCVLSATDILGTYLPAFGEEHGWSASFVGGLLALRAGASMAMRVGLGRLSGRFGRGPVLGAAMAAAAGAFLLMPFLADSLPAVVVLMAVAGAGLGIGQPLTLAWVASIVEPRVRATAMSVRMVGNRVGQVSLPVAAGSLAAVAGVGGVLTATGLMVGLGIVGVLRGRPGRARLAGSPAGRSAPG